jgi:hypothetical protein
MITLPVRIIFLAEQTRAIHWIVSPSILSANFSGFMLNPVLNISGSITTSIFWLTAEIFSSSIRRFADLSSQ